jgi:geranylgeranyl diphosphate synthase type II
MVEQHSKALGSFGSPRDLRDGCRYVLTGGGKRLRAILVILSAEAVGGSAKRAVHAGIALETLHNFTLVHDDIMDKARTRRGRPTVHTKWNPNTALLVGDVLLGLAYRSMAKGQSIPLIHEMTDTLIDVCEGQALDMEFEHRTDVTVKEYFEMIEKKTGRLIAGAAATGGVIGGGSRRHIRALRSYGHYLGRAFQLQDDLLDAVGTEEELGKPTGGDIAEGKKTFLLLSAYARARGSNRRLLRNVMTKTTDKAMTRAALTGKVTSIYRDLGVLRDAERIIDRDTRRAVDALSALPDSVAVDMLTWLALQLSRRAS